MNQEVKTEWLTLLREPGRPQTTGALDYRSSPNDVQPTGQCCLGVLADALAGVYNIEPWNPERRSSGAREISRALGYDPRGATGYLPRPLLALAGIDEDTQIHLARRNDAGATFTQIADWIEENL